MVDLMIMGSLKGSVETSVGVLKTAVIELQPANQAIILIRVLHISR